MRAVLAAVVCLATVSCGSGDRVVGETALKQHVKGNRYGSSPDQWIEAKNAAGEWEETGLIFGYAGVTGDQDECLKAIAGMKQANPAREYRCELAN